MIPTGIITPYWMSPLHQIHSQPVPGQVMTPPLADPRVNDASVEGPECLGLAAAG